MTMSFQAFRATLNDEVIIGMWNTDGTIGIVQKPINHPDRMTLEELGAQSPEERAKDKYVSLIPLEIDTILKEGKFEFDGIRPGLIPMREKISACVKEGIVEIASTTKMFGQPLPEETLHIPLTMLKEIFDACKGVCKENRFTIRPLVGLNCKAGSFEAMEGDLSSLKENEEDRVLLKNFLENNL